MTPGIAGMSYSQRHAGKELPLQALRVLIKAARNEFGLDYAKQGSTTWVHCCLEG